MRKGWLRPGEPADDNHTQYVMPDTFNPADRGNFGHEVIFSPKGQQAPPELVNYTPATGEVHDVGQPAPREHEQLSLRPTAPGPSPGVYQPPAPVAPRPLSSRGWAGGAAGAVGMGSDDNGDGIDDETGDPVDDGSDFESALQGMPPSVRQTLTSNPRPGGYAPGEVQPVQDVAAYPLGPSVPPGVSLPPAVKSAQQEAMDRAKGLAGGGGDQKTEKVNRGPGNGYDVYNATDPANPTFIRHVGPPVIEKISRGAGKGYDRYDTTDPTNPKKLPDLGGDSTAPAGPKTQNIYNRKTGGYDVYDVSDPANPKPTGKHIGGDASGGNAQPQDIEGYIRQAAAARGIDPQTAVNVAMSEGGVTEPAKQSNSIYQGEREKSFGPFQLNIQGGLGNAFQQATGKSPADPTAWKMGVDFALDDAAKNGWGAFHGAARVGIGPRDGLAGSKPVGIQSGPVSGAGGETVRIRDPKTGAYTVYDAQTNAVVGHIGPDGTSTSATPAAGANSRFRPVTDSRGNLITVDQATGEPTLVSSGNPWKIVPTGNGGQMRVNIETGDTQQLSTEASRQAGRSIFQIGADGTYQEVVRAPADLKVAITADQKRITTIDPDTGAGRIIWVEDGGGIKNIPGMGIVVPPGKKLTVQTKNGPVIYDGGKANGPPVRMQDIPAQPGRSGPPQGAGGPPANPARVVDTANAQPGASDGRRLPPESWNPDNLSQSRTDMQASADQQVPSALQLFGALDYRGRESQMGPFAPGAGPGPAGQGDSIYDAFRAGSGYQDTGDPSAGINDTLGDPSSQDFYGDTSGPADYTPDDSMAYDMPADNGDQQEPDVGWGQRVGKGETGVGGPPIRQDPNTGPDPNANPIIDPPPPPPPHSDPNDFGPGPGGGDLGSAAAGSRGAGSTSFGGVRGRLSGRLAAGRSLEGWEPTHAATSTDTLAQELASSTGTPPAPPPTPEPPAVGTGAAAVSGGDAQVPASGWTPPISEESIVGGGNKFGDQVSMEGTHRGTDLQAVKGTPTVSPVAGMVTRVEFKKAGLGLQVVIRDEQGQEHRLSHLDKALVKEGEFVDKGQQVATVGESGTGATGPHLDYRVEQNGQEVNPEPMMGDLANLPPHPDTIQEDGSVGSAGAGVGTGRKKANKRHNPMNLDMHNGGIGNDLRALAMSDPRSGGGRPNWGPSGMYDQAGNRRIDFSGNLGKWGKVGSGEGEENLQLQPEEDGSGGNGGDNGDGGKFGETDFTKTFDGSGDGSSGGGDGGSQFDESNLGTLIPSGANSPFAPSRSIAGASTGRTAAGRSSSGSGAVSHDALQAAEEQIAWDRDKFAQQLGWEQSQFGQQLGWDQSKFQQDLTWQQQKWMQDLSFQHDKLDVEVQRLNSDAQAEEKRYQLNIQQAQTQRAAAVEEMRHNRAMEVLGRYQAQLDERNQALNRQQQRVLQGTYAQHRQADLQDSALKNPWVQSLTGMAPEYGSSGGPGWNSGATPNGYQTMFQGWTPVAPKEEPWEPIPMEPTAPGTEVSGSDPNDPANKWLNEFLANTSSTGPNAIVNPNTPTTAVTPPAPIKLPPAPTFNTPSMNIQAPGVPSTKSYSSLSEAIYGEGLQGVGHYNIDDMSQDDLNGWLQHLWEGGSGWDDPRIVKIMDAAGRSGYDTSIYNQWKGMGNQPLGSPFPSGSSDSVPRMDPQGPADTSTLSEVIRDPSINEENPNIGIGQRSKKRRRVPAGVGW